MDSQITHSLDAFMAERSEVLEKAKQIHALAIQQAADDAKKAQENADETKEKTEVEEKKKKGPSKPRWMLLYEAKFESYAKLLSS